MRASGGFRLTRSLICLALFSLSQAGAVHAAVHLTRTAPSPICLGQPFQIQGSFGSMPPKASVQIRPDAPKDNRIFHRWRGAEIGWHADHLTLNMPPTPIVPGIYRLVVEGSGVFEALRHVQIANCRKLPAKTKLENSPTALKALPPAGKAIEPPPRSTGETPEQVRPTGNPTSAAPGGLGPQQMPVPLNTKPQNTIPGAVKPQLRFKPPTIQSFEAHAVGIRGTTDPCELMIRTSARDNLEAPVHAMIAFQTGDNVRKVVIASERVDGLVRQLWSRESAGRPLPVADRDTSTHPLDLVLPWGTRQVILTATSTDGVEAHRTVKLTVNVPLQISSQHRLREVIDSVHSSGPRPYAKIHYEGSLALELAANKWAILRIRVSVLKADSRRVHSFEAALTGTQLKTDSWLWELGTDPSPADASYALIHVTYQTPCYNPGVSEWQAGVELVPTASRPPGV